MSEPSENSSWLYPAVLLQTRVMDDIPVASLDVPCNVTDCEAAHAERAAPLRFPSTEDYGLHELIIRPLFHVLPLHELPPVPVKPTSRQKLSRQVPTHAKL